VWETSIPDQPREPNLQNLDASGAVAPNAKGGGAHRAYRFDSDAQWTCWIDLGSLHIAPTLNFTLNVDMVELDSSLTL